MRFLSLLLNLLLFNVSVALAASTPTAPAMRFVRNEGQWDKDILYRADLPGGYLFLKRNSLQYVFYDTKAVSRQHVHGSENQSSGRQSFQSPVESDVIKAHGYEVSFKGASKEVVLEGSSETGEKKNYYLSEDATQWATDVPAFSEVLYRNLYRGIDLRLFTQNGTAKYELLVAPGADPSRIKLVYEGMSELSLKDGFLVTKTTVNTITETPPVCYQTTRTGQQEVAANYVLKGNEVTFGFPQGYRRNQPLTIDPFLVFSTYSGSFSDNWGFTATYDEDGNLYSGGIEFGVKFPATNGAFQVKFAGTVDVAILKYTPDGSKLLYATYLGGSRAEVPHSLIVNKANELIIFGTTSSDNFPKTAGAYDNTFGGGKSLTPLSGITYEAGSDLYVAKLNAAGNQLLGSTYLGGSGNDGLNVSTQSTVSNYGDQFRGEVNLDDAGTIYVATTTTSTNFPLQNASQTTLSGEQDGVVCKLSSDLTSLLWSTYFGGTGYEGFSGIRIGRSGSVYVCGGTTSKNLPVTAGVLKPTMSDAEDGMVVKFSGNTAASVSYIGTANQDQLYLIDLDKSENVYVMGLTYGQYPVTAGTYQKGSSGQFIHAINNTFTQTLFSTVVSSGKNFPDISPTAFMVSDCGFIYLTGWGGEVSKTQGFTPTSITGLPVSTDALQKTTSGDGFYLMILSENATDLLYGTFFGGASGNNHVDGGTSRFRKDGTIYHAVCACRDNSTFPTTPGAWSNKNNGDVTGPNDQGTTTDGCNNIAFKFELDGLDAAFTGEVEGCTPYTGNFNNTSKGGKTYQWQINGQNMSTAAGPFTYAFNEPGEYTVTLLAYNPATCKQVDTVSRKISVRRSTEISVNPNSKICFGETAQLRANGGVKYEWSPISGLNNPNIANPVATPAQTTEYRVKITNEFGCAKELRTRVEVTNDLQPAFDIFIKSECAKPERVVLINKTGTADRYVWLLGNGDTLSTDAPETYSYDQPGEYEIVLQAFQGACMQSSRTTVKIENPAMPPNVITPDGDGQNETFMVHSGDGETTPLVPLLGWKLEVYDRWGRPVYLNDSYQNDWGNNAVAGMYFYRLTSPRGASCKGWLQVLK